MNLETWIISAEEHRRCRDIINNPADLTIKKLVEDAHKNAKDKGFHDTQRNIGETLMLIVSELGEALESHRCGKHATWIHKGAPLLKDHYKRYFESGVKDTFEDEIADVFIRLADLCGMLNIDIEEYIRMKMAYNSMRERKHGKNY